MTRPHFIEGDSYVQDDVTGLKIRRSEAVKRWDGALTTKANWERRHPQEFVRAKQEKIIAHPVRPESLATVIGPLITRTIAPSTIGATSISVESSVRMLPADQISIMLDIGDTFRAEIVSIPDTETINFTPALPRAVEIGAVITNYTAISEPAL